MIKKYGYYESFEENYQDSMVVLLESVYEYEPEQNVIFPAFYKRKLFYHYMNIIRNQTDHINYTQEIPCLEEIPEESQCVDDQQLDDLIWQEDRATLHAAINKLTTRQKWIIEQHYFKGKKLTELSTQYDIHYQSIVKLKARALKSLKIYLQPKVFN